MVEFENDIEVIVELRSSLNNYCAVLFATLATAVTAVELNNDATFFADGTVSQRFK